MPLALPPSAPHSPQIRPDDCAHSTILYTRESARAYPHPTRVSSAPRVLHFSQTPIVRAVCRAAPAVPRIDIHAESTWHRVVPSWRVVMLSPLYQSRAAPVQTTRVLLLPYCEYRRVT